MYDRTIALIQSYIYDELSEPRLYLPRGMFEIRSYSRWAAEELLIRLMNESLQLPPHLTGRQQRTSMEIIESFINDMDYYSCKSKNPDVNIIFSTAKDTAVNIYDYFLAAN
jgi:hypothetical protein